MEFVAKEKYEEEDLATKTWKVVTQKRTGYGGRVRREEREVGRLFFGYNL